MEAVAEREGTSTKAGTPSLLRKAAVLGAGTMGSRIAAHLANAGVSVLLLAQEEQARSFLCAIRRHAHSHGQLR